MIYPLSILSIFLLFLIHLTSGHPDCAHAKNDTIPFSTRAFWMRRANAVLAYSGSPCPFGAFGTVIVNHTDLSHGPMGREVCVGVNAVRSGNPTLHGEIAGINNCSQILTDPKGEYNLTASQVALAWPTLSLYTNAESCPMCASAIRWAGFKENIYGTSIAFLIAKGWSQINLGSDQLFALSTALSSTTKLIGGVLANETDPFFEWQYDTGYPCPKGCARGNGTSCAASKIKAARWEL